MPMQEVENVSQGRLIHIDSTMILPGQKGLIDVERAKSGPVKAMIDANWLELGDVVDDAPEAPQPKATPAPAPKPPPTPQR